MEAVQQLRMLTAVIHGNDLSTAECDGKNIIHIQQYNIIIQL